MEKGECSPDKRRNISLLECIQCKVLRIKNKMTFLIWVCEKKLLNQVKISELYVYL